jgi:hypothetical protein
MTHHYFTHTIFLGWILVVFAGFARADTVQCVDETGTVTYTDVPCENGADAARASALTDSSPVRAKVSSPAGTFTAVGEARESAWVKKPASNRKLAPDVATVKAARSSMLLMDRAASLLRQQKFAALDLRSQRWFDF